MSIWSPYVFPGVVFAAWAGLHVYAWQRVRWTLGAGPAGSNAIAAIFVILGSLYPLGRFLVDRMGAHGGLLVLWPGTVYLGFIITAAAILVPIDIVIGLPFAVVKSVRVPPGRAASAVGVVLRAALPAACIASVALCIAGASSALGPARVTEIEKTMPGLPTSLDGFRLVQLSDVHAGYIAGEDALDDALGRVAALNADLVVVTGDIDDDPRGGDGGVAAKIAGVPSRYGVLSTTGNHEFRTGGEATVFNYRRAGLTVLRQQNQVVAGGLVVAGVDDIDFLGGLLGSAPAIRKSLEGAPGGLPVVLLSHRPVKWDVAAHAGVDLMLCGHTHGGQVFPLHLVLKWAYDGFVSGRYEIGGMTLYVNNGIGFWGPPMRIMADPEILVVTLRSGAKRGTDG